MVKDYDIPSAKELCSRIVRLTAKVEKLQDTVAFLESEVLALGNILIKNNVLTLKDLETFTAAVIKQKIAEKNIRSTNSGMDLREEFEDALQEKIIQ